MKIFLSGFISFFILTVIMAPTAVLAHVRWFTDGNLVPSPDYSFSDWPVIAWMLAAFFVILIGVFLEKRSRELFSFPSLQKIHATAVSLFSIGIGMGFLIFSLKHFIFAPNVPAEGIFGFFLLAIQAIVGLSFIFGFAVRAGAVVLLALYVFAVAHFGLIIIDALEVVGIAIMLFILGRPRWSIFDMSMPSAAVARLQPLAIPCLRVFTGLNLFLLGFSEKILNPELGMRFLQIYPWNFMQQIGFAQYSDYWFVLSAGVVEALLGMFFILGIVTRLTVVVTAVFFIATLFLLGPIELTGHMLHFAILAIVFLFGAGNRLKLIRS